MKPGLLYVLKLLVRRFRHRCGERPEMNDAIRQMARRLEVVKQARVVGVIGGVNFKAVRVTGIVLPGGDAEYDAPCRLQGLFRGLGYRAIIVKDQPACARRGGRRGDWGRFPAGQKGPVVHRFAAW